MTTIVAATATINGKDVELLKAGAIEQKVVTLLSPRLRQNLPRRVAIII
ncbi:hypothetical protein HTZ85_06295 [Escherichia coli]|nr:hypothetical protein [Escherichia coli]